MPYADPEVRKEWKKKWYVANKDKLKELNKKWREENKEYLKKYYEENSNIRILYSLKKRAKAKGLEFNLTHEDVVYPDVCPVLQIPLQRNIGGKKSTANSPSVDKIRPELGYVKGNVQVISQKANAMKHNATPEELRMFAKWVLRTFPEDVSDG